MNSLSMGPLASAASAPRPDAQGAAQKQKLSALAKNLVEYEKFAQKDVVIPDVAARPKEDSVRISDAARAKEEASARADAVLRNG